VNNQPWR